MVQFFVSRAIDSDCAALFRLGDPLGAIDFPEPIHPGYPSDGFSNSARRPLRILLLGDERDVTATIGILQQRGFAQRSEWSRLISCQQAIESIDGILSGMPADTVMGLLTRYFVD